jgi:hypothetical protein
MRLGPRPEPTAVRIAMGNTPAALSAGSIIALASSGSRSSISSIEPLISANNAVTVLRSPSTVAEPPIHSAMIGFSGVLRGDAGECAPALLAESVVPQSPQKRLAGGFSAPHLGQRFVNCAPQSPQNRFSSGLLLPHFEQRMFPQSA